MNVAIVIPALDPTGRLVRLVHDIFSLFSPHVIIVNDGSGDSSVHIFNDLELLGCDILQHPRNLGKGAAIKSGICHALSVYPDICGVVTADADGQHTARDIFRIAGRLAEDAEGADGDAECTEVDANSAEDAEGADEDAVSAGGIALGKDAGGIILGKDACGIVLGVRDFTNKQVPFKSQWGNKTTSFIFQLQTGITLCDTQTGLRAIPKQFLAVALQTRGDRYEYEMNMLLRASKMQITLTTIPIETVYSDNNSTSHFRAVRDSARIYWEILKFGCSSVACAAVDFLLFAALATFVFYNGDSGIAISTVLARMVSGTCNFLINRFIVFHGNGEKTFVKYLSLFIAQMSLSALFTTLLARSYFAAPAAKLLVDSFLFIISFIIQRKYIFEKKVDANRQADGRGDG